MAARHGGARPGAGRPKGKVSKAKLDISERAKTHGELALQTLVDVMSDPDAPHNAKVSAANAMLDRGFGRPMQAVEMTGADGGAIKTEATVSDDLRQALDAIAGKITGSDSEG